MLIVSLQKLHFTVDLEPSNTTFLEQFVQTLYEDTVVVAITSKQSVFFVEGSGLGGVIFGKSLHCSIEHPDWEVTRDKMTPSRFRRTLLKT